MNKKKMKSLEVKLEEQMTLEQRSVWIAASFSSCQTMGDYVRKAHDYDDVMDADFFRQMHICQRLAETDRENWEEHHRGAYDCYFRATLAESVNRDLENALLRMGSRHFYNRQILDLKIEADRLYKKYEPENSRGICLCLESEIWMKLTIYQRDLIPVCDAYSIAAAKISEEYFCGDAFLTRSNTWTLGYLIEVHKKEVERLKKYKTTKDLIPEEEIQRLTQYHGYKIHDDWVSYVTARADDKMKGDDSSIHSIMRTINLETMDDYKNLIQVLS